MTLSFSQKWPKHMGEWAGQPNYFIEKIIKGISDSDKDFYAEYCSQCGWKGMSSITVGAICPKCGYHALRYCHEGPFFGDDGYYSHLDHKPKLHTIRHDPHGRWKPGMTIHPVINNRTPNRFQFAPEIVCTGVQEIKIKHGMFGFKSVWIDGNITGNFSENFIGENPVCTDLMRTIAINDGFDSLEQFFAYFNEDFTGKIIHWTDLKY